MSAGKWLKITMLSLKCFDTRTMIENYPEIAEKLEGLKKALLDINSTLKGRLKFLAAADKFARKAPREFKGIARHHNIVKYMATFRDLPEPLSSALVVMQDELSGKPCLEICKIETLGDTTARISFDEGGEASRILDCCTHRLPVAICIGGDPLYNTVAAMSTPDYINKFLVAGVLRDKPVGLVKCFSQNLMVPQDFDIVVEGYIQKSENMFHISCLSRAAATATAAAAKPKAPAEE